MILFTGGNGQLGLEIRRRDSAQEFLMPTRSELNILNPAQMRGYKADQRITSIVHAAAYTDSRSPEVSPQSAKQCYEANVLGTRMLVEEFKHIPFYFISTESAISPHNFYAITKLAAENEVKKHPNYTIIRTSFYNRPFEYPKACEDVFTIADYIDIIAPLIIEKVKQPPTNSIEYVGTGIKTVYDLAVKSLPEVEKVSYKSLPFPLVSREELVELFKPSKGKK